MGDISRKGRSPLLKGMIGRMGRSTPKNILQEMTPNEALGVMVTGGLKGKPHSTKEGREASGKRHVARFFGMFKDKKKGVKV